mmetsp:Transcript_40075/g.115186  ORF Transcript_40075/g.115186 Transcript_40075/m.115186 type:complete len:223 (+) Transcript_40075:739-1407(+)
MHFRRALLLHLGEPLQLLLDTIEVLERRGGCVHGLRPRGPRVDESLAELRGLGLLLVEALPQLLGLGLCLLQRLPVDHGPCPRRGLLPALVRLRTAKLRRLCRRGRLGLRCAMRLCRRRTRLGLLALFRRFPLQGALLLPRRLACRAALGELVGQRRDARVRASLCAQALRLRDELVVPPPQGVEDGAELLLHAVGSLQLAALGLEQRSPRSGASRGNGHGV